MSYVVVNIAINSTIKIYVACDTRVFALPVYKNKIQNHRGFTETDNKSTW